jgi:hypothetical protein
MIREASNLGSVNLETVNCGLCEFLVLAGRLCFLLIVELFGEWEIRDGGGD